ncbi:MAG TPA: YitT family protein, partial [Clostridia bacterium]|nr:YitT family protein [Clostridia bacterium]
MRAKLIPILRNTAGLSVGVVLIALAYPLFFLDNRIAPGGLTGVAMVINHLWSVPVGLLTFFLNLPLFLVSFLRRGGAFVLRSFLAMVFLSAIIDL